MRSVSIINAALIVCVLSAWNMSSARASEMTISGSPPLTVAVGQEYNFTPTVRNADRSRLQFNYVNLPGWSKHYRGSGRITGTPEYPGVYPNIQIGAWDGSHYVVLPSFTITVAAASGGSGSSSGSGGTAAPSLNLSGTPSSTAQVGAYYSFTPTLTASAGLLVTYSVSNKPAWAQFNTATGALSGTPSSGSVGTDSNVGISVASGSLKATLPNFAINVSPAVAGVATLLWSKPTANTDGSPLTNLAGYVIRYGTSVAALNSRISLAASATSASIENLAAGLWYFEIASINSANIQSQFSGAASKSVQ